MTTTTRARYALEFNQAIRSLCDCPGWPEHCCGGPDAGRAAGPRRHAGDS